jgi:hypothetical protein
MPHIDTTPLVFCLLISDVIGRLDQSGMDGTLVHLSHFSPGARGTTLVEEVMVSKREWEALNTSPIEK